MAEDTQKAEKQEPEAAPQEPTTRKRRPVNVEATPDHVIYVSTAKHAVPFDIQIAGEVIPGNWSAKDGFVEFLVPKALVEGFERHFHFTAGNVVAAE